MRPLVFVFVVACGSAPPPSSTVEVREEAPTTIERACFTGASENGVCEIFDGSREPLTLLSSHCQGAGGHWMEACPTEGRTGTCAGEGRRAIYYGTPPAAVQQACEAEGHVFTP